MQEALRVGIVQFFTNHLNEVARSLTDFPDIKPRRSSLIGNTFTTSVKSLLAAQSQSLAMPRLSMVDAAGMDKAACAVFGAAESPRWFAIPSSEKRR